VIKTTAQILLVSGVVMGLCVSPGLAAGGRHCQDIGGGVLTNFLDPTQCASPVGLCTDGPVTGDLRGASPRGQWKCLPRPASLGDRVGRPASDPKRVLADYLDGVDITGGTGRFDGATGHLSSVFGAVDLNLGQITLRYAGTICFRPPSG